jgi:uncharacterized RDD family membrane protein YckC
MKHRFGGGEKRGRPAGIGLVVASAIYDGLVALAILFAATALVVTANGGNSIPPGTIVYELGLTATPFPYFAWCWLHGGRTLGMRAWRVRLARTDGGPMTIRDAATRYVGALLSWSVCGLGFLWMLLPPAHMSWHDRLSATRVYRDI